MRGVVLVAHVVFGTLGLLLGPTALLTRGRLRRAAHDAYHLAVAGVTLSAAVLAATALSRLWWLLPVAAASQAAALLGLRALRRRQPGWPSACAHLLGGSYIALLTGVLIASTGNLLFWVLPAVVAQWPIAVAKRRRPDPRPAPHPRRRRRRRHDTAPFGESGGDSVPLSKGARRLGLRSGR